MDHYFTNVRRKLAVLSNQWFPLVFEISHPKYSKSGHVVRHNRRENPRAQFLREDSHRCQICRFSSGWPYLCSDEVFPIRWRDGRRMVELPAWSLDLTLLDYFLWRYFKSKGYLTWSTNFKVVKLWIHQEILNMIADVLANVKHEFVNCQG